MGRKSNYPSCPPPKTKESGMPDEYNCHADGSTTRELGKHYSPPAHTSQLGEPAVRGAPAGRSTSEKLEELVPATALIYKLGERAVRVPPPPTYEQAVQLARDTFPETLKHVSATRISLVLNHGRTNAVALDPPKWLNVFPRLPQDKKITIIVPATSVIWGSNEHAEEACSRYPPRGSELVHPRSLDSRLGSRDLLHPGWSPSSSRANAPASSTMKHDTR